MYPRGYSKWHVSDWGIRNKIKKLRKKYGFSVDGSFRYPEASDGVRQVTFQR